MSLKMLPGFLSFMIVLVAIFAIVYTYFIKDKKMEGFLDMGAAMGIFFGVVAILAMFIAFAVFTGMFSN